MSSHPDHERRDTLVAESPGAGGCARRGCDFMAEVPVRRFDTGEIRHLCRSCARLLNETVEGIEAIGMTDEMPPFEKPRDRTPTVTARELRLELAMLKHIDGDDTVTSPELAADLGVSPSAVAAALERLDGEVIEPVPDAMGTHKAWRIL